MVQNRYTPEEDIAVTETVPSASVKMIQNGMKKLREINILKMLSHVSSQDYHFHVTKNKAKYRSN
jgi:hypothetical protein